MSVKYDLKYPTKALLIRGEGTQISKTVIKVMYIENKASIIAHTFDISFDYVGSNTTCCNFKKVVLKYLQLSKKLFFFFDIFKNLHFFLIYLNTLPFNAQNFCVLLLYEFLIYTICPCNLKHFECTLKSTERNVIEYHYYSNHFDIQYFLSNSHMFTFSVFKKN